MPGERQHWNLACPEYIDSACAQPQHDRGAVAVRVRGPVIQLQDGRLPQRMPDNHRDLMQDPVQQRQLQRFLLSRLEVRARAYRMRLHTLVTVLTTSLVDMNVLC